MPVLDATGKPYSPKTNPCPRCAAGPDKREPSGGFGTVHLLCTNCGFEFKDQKCEKLIP